MTNNKYLDKAKITLNSLITIGNYHDDVLILIGDDLKDIISKHNLENDNTFVKHFPDLDRHKIIEILKLNPITVDRRELNKIFQWHKIHIFDVYFKQWKKCFYIDVGMYIFKSIDKFLNLDCKNKLLAHSDSYPKYEWKLEIQFDSIIFKNLYKELNDKYNLQIDYFQSGILLYDTNIIENDTKKNLIDLSNKYINSKTNEQGIMNLYFNCIKKIWSQVAIKDNETNYYDYWERFGNKPTDYIMLKYPRYESI
jgi:hypothetical protein